MKTFVVTQNLADKGTGNVDNNFTETKVEQSFRYDLVFHADYYTIGANGALCFWQYLNEREAKGIMIKTNEARVATLAEGQWEGVFDATDCEAW